MTPQQYGPLIGIGIAVLVILLRNRQKRTLRPELMWILPSLFTALIGFGLWGMRQAPGADLSPYGPADWGLLVGGAVLAALGGFWRGSMVTVEKAPDGLLNAQERPRGVRWALAGHARLGEDATHAPHQRGGNDPPRRRVRTYVTDRSRCFPLAHGTLSSPATAGCPAAGSDAGPKRPSGVE